MNQQDQFEVQALIGEKMQQERQRMEAEEIQKRLADIVAQSYDRGGQYTTLVISLGFAGFFTAWGNLRSHIGWRFSVASLLLVLIALFFFMTWEVYGAFYRDAAVMSWLKIYEEDPANALKNWKAAQVQELKRKRKNLKFLVISRYGTLVPGLLGGLVLIVAGILSLLKK